MEAVAETNIERRVLTHPDSYFFPFSKGYDFHDDGDSRNVRHDSRDYADWKCFEVIRSLLYLFSEIPTLSVFLFRFFVLLIHCSDVPSMLITNKVLDVELPRRSSVQSLW